MSETRDPEILAYCIHYDKTLITVNAKDLRKHCCDPEQIHPSELVLLGIAILYPAQVNSVKGV